MKCSGDRINGEKSKNTVKSWFGKPETSVLQSVQPEGQERTLVIKWGRNQERTAFLKALFGKDFGNRLINIIKGSCNFQEG